MRELNFMINTIVLTAISLSSIYGQRLDENLDLLEPFTNQIW